MVAMKFIAIFCVLGIVLANDDLRKINSISQEPSCTSQGGTCTISTDCPANSLVEESGLCPLQQRMGVECCSGISEKETRCQRRGGDCMTNCRPQLQDIRATDCPEKTFCCILI